MTREGERELVKVEHVNGGDGYIVREAMVTSEEVGEACKMYAKIHLDPGCEVGYHYHHGETESYFILTGHGTYDDNGEKQPANPGDLFLCKDGDVSWKVSRLVLMIISPSHSLWKSWCSV